MVNFIVKNFINNLLHILIDFRINKLIKICDPWLEQSHDILVIILTWFLHAHSLLVAANVFIFLFELGYDREMYFMLDLFNWFLKLCLCF